MPSACLFSLLVAVSNAVCREHSLQICGLLLHTLSSSMILSLVLPREQSSEFGMFNRREVLACLFSYVSSWLQFDRIKPNCILASQLVYSLFQHTCSLFSPSFSWQYKSWEKRKSEKNPGILLLKKFNPLQLSAFPIIKSSCCFAIPCRQKPGVMQ